MLVFSEQWYHDRSSLLSTDLTIKNELVRICPSDLFLLRGCTIFNTKFFGDDRANVVSYRMFISHQKFHSLGQVVDLISLVDRKVDRRSIGLSHLRGLTGLHPHCFPSFDLLKFLLSQLDNIIGEEIIVSNTILVRLSIAR